MYNETHQLPTYYNPDYLDYFIQIVTDQRYKCTAYELAETYSSQFNDMNIFSYLYGYRISTTNLPLKYEAVHRDELAMIFAEPLSIKQPPLTSSNIWSSTLHDYSIEERLISERMVKYWTNFIKNDDPNDEGLSVKWKKYNEEKSDENRNLFFIGRISIEKNSL